MTCKVFRGGARACEKPAIAVVRDVFDEAPYDVRVCDGCGERYLDKGFAVVLLSDLDGTSEETRDGSPTR